MSRLSLSQERTHHFLDPRNHKRSSSWGIKFIVPVLIGDNDTVVTNVIASVADDEDFGGSNGAKTLVPIWISESNN